MLSNKPIHHETINGAGLQYLITMFDLGGGEYSVWRRCGQSSRCATYQSIKAAEFSYRANVEYCQEEIRNKEITDYYYAATTS